MGWLRAAFVTFLRGFSLRSLASLVVLVTVGAYVGYRWSDLVDANGRVDVLLFGTWLWMAVLICWRVQPWRDLILIGVGLGGGTVIEWWGTNTELWTYFTDERPPPWILPAWPIASIAIDRMGRMVTEIVAGLEAMAGGQIPPRAFTVTYWILVPGFVVWMSWWIGHTAELLATQVVIALMVATTVAAVKPRRDVLLFVAGAGMGIFLEYWGTSRQCWTYYTHEVPPVIAVVAHGFAAVAFARTAELVDAVIGRGLRAVGLEPRVRGQPGGAAGQPGGAPARPRGAAAE